MKKLLKISKILSVLIVAFAASYAQSAPKNQNAAPQNEAKKIQKPKPSVENFQRYESANKQLKKAPIAVFMGDSITDNWARMDKEFFETNNYAGRGIGGQVTCQMLARFRPDVIDLKPQIVLILAGTNDIAQNLGYISNENICKNIISMCELAKANKIIPVICSVLPAHQYVWRKHIDSIPLIADLNAKLKAYADANNVEYLDYYSAIVDERKGLTPADSKDGVHPTTDCYKNKLDKMAKERIEKILSGKN